MKVIYFDFFGVLCEPIYRFVILRHIPGPGGTALVKRLDFLDNGSVTEEEFVKEISALSGVSEADIWAEVHMPPKINKELLEFIDTHLKGTYRLGLLTNIPRSMFDRLLPDATIFDILLISSELKVVKPDPKIFELAIKRAECAPEEILFVDDKL